METATMGRRREWGGMLAVLRLLTIVTVLQQWKAEAFQITVQKTECIFQFVDHEAATVSGSFVVVDKQFAWHAEKEDIEMVVTGPLGNKVLAVKARGGQKFQFKATKVGHYSICFFNPTPDAEKVDFSIHVGLTLDSKDVAKDEHFDPLEAKILQLREALEKLSLEQQYYKSRDVRHRRTNESTQNRLLFYTAMEYLFLIIVSLMQVYLIQRLFSRRIGYNKV